jgi:hypothetical protein
MEKHDKGHDKEKRPQYLTDNCDRCEETYDITPSNGKIVHHANQPECDYIHCTCPHCEYQTMIFIGDNSFEQGVNSGLDVQVNKFASVETHAWWMQIKGIVEPKTYELTDRHEALVKKFGENILAIPDSVFWDNVEAPTEHPYPNLWV